MPNNIDLASNRIFRLESILYEILDLLEESSDNYVVAEDKETVDEIVQRAYELLESENLEEDLD